MDYRITDMRNKEVINNADGERMGYIYDVMFSVDTGEITAVILPGENKLFGFFGRGDDIIIPWEKVKRVSSDMILVEVENKKSSVRN